MSGFLVTGVFDAVRQWRQSRDRQRERVDDRRDWHAQRIFDQRIEALRSAYSHLSRITEAVGRRDTDDGESLRLAGQDARVWFNDNMLWLHDGLPRTSHFIGLANVVSIGQFDVDQYMARDRDVRQMLRDRAQQLLGAALDA